MSELAETLGNVIYPDAFKTLEVAPEPPTEGRLVRFKRTLGRMAAFGTLAAVGGLGFGVAAVHLSNAPTTLGPHEAKVHMTTDANLTLDWGWPGKIVKPLDHSTMGEGAYIDIGESPIDPHASTTEQLSPEAVIKQYAGFFSNPDRDINGAKNSLINHFEGAAEFGGLVTLLSALSLYAVIGPERRRQLRDTAPRKIQLSLLAASLAFTMVPSAEAKATPQELPTPNPIFDGTPLEGAYVTGQFLTALTDTIVPKVIDAVRENTQFYDGLLANLKTSIAQNQLLVSTADTITLMHTSDKHCNMNINKLLGVIAQRANVNQVVDTGDSVLGGTPLDDTCTDSNNYYLRNRQRIVVEGNHRSLDTENRERKDGAHVLDGSIITVDHVRYLGGPNQNISLFGSEIQPVGDETNGEMGQHLADIACSDPAGVDILAGATPDAVIETLRRGCAKLGLVGGRVQTLKMILSMTGKEIPLYEVGSTGGVKGDEITLGPLQKPATVALIQLNKFTHEPVYQQIITFNPDKTVTIGPINDLTTVQPS